MTDQGTILVVDDTPDMLELLVHNLAGAGYQVRPVSSGELALAAVADNPPDLILLDLFMPSLNGMEVCRRLKANPVSRDIPVVFISAFGQSAERVAGLQEGAVDFITKPFQREELVARIQTHLELRRLRVRLEQQAAQLRHANEQLEAELAERKRAEQELQQKNVKLADALSKVKLLSGMLPICSGCKKIRDDQGYWSQVEGYIQKHSEATFTHGMCPDCIKKLYPDVKRR